ncbi:MAG: endonuclease/exonuclease/phosphatase family protein [Telmatospirillum sp.]|nr:endonuclease/exonuclease/phosphatase family protein [Telmatospirillum sp.]
MKFASYNIQYGKGKDGRFDLARIAASVADADVIALQEVERFWPRSGNVDQPAELAALLPDFYWVYGPGYDMDADAGRPGGKRRQFGNMLLSRTPIATSRNHLLPKYGAVGQFCLQRSALEGVIETRAAGALRLYSLHLSHIDDGDRAAQVERLIEIHRTAPDEGGAWFGAHKEADWTQGRPPPPMPQAALFMGDFNITHRSPLYARLVGPLSAEHGRVTAKSGFVDAYVAAGNDVASGWSCDSTLTHRERIDFCMASASLAKHIKRAWIDNDAQGSDHQPIWTEIEL